MNVLCSKRRLELLQGLLLLLAVLCLISCSTKTVDNSSAGGDSSSNQPKADYGDLTDVEWANQFFLTQIYDELWNPDGIENDTSSNNCGPASFAMLMAQREVLPAELTAEMSIDHARATMYLSYPEIDPTELPEDATLYEEQKLVLVDDDTHPVYFDITENEASLAQGIKHNDGEPVFGYSWDELDALLAANGAVIAHGHITQSWRNRFDGEYGDFGEGTISHFITVFRATSDNDFIVCDPMHKGGAVLMARNKLQTFFKSPINVYETAIRVIAWVDSPESEEEPEEEAAPESES